MRGGEQGAEQLHGQRYARPEISASLLATARGLTNNKLKARDWEDAVFCKVVALAEVRLYHGFFSVERLRLLVVFLTNGSHFVHSVRNFC